VQSVCVQNDFNIAVTAKQCDRIDCSVDTDCCGSRPLVAPARCANYESICQTPNLPGCQPFLSCTDDSTCGAGTCGMGTCTFGGSCATTADCDSNTCVGSLCTLTNNFCDSLTPCTNFTNSCSTRRCSCTNPEYDFANPICDDEDCTDVCNLRCREEMCVVDNSCEEDIDCAPFGLEHCNAGTCVECEADSDCEDEDHECRDNECVAPCKYNEECPLFHQCQSGDCVATGCTSDRECVLALSEGNLGQDARLSKCLPATPDSPIMTCKIPCENDAACPTQFEVCSEGYCTFIGCETNEECRSFLGLDNQMTSTLRPYISTAECRE